MRRRLVELEHLAQLGQRERLVVGAVGEEVGAQALRLSRGDMHRSDWSTTHTPKSDAPCKDLMPTRAVGCTLILSSSMALTFSAAPGPGIRFHASGLKICTGNRRVVWMDQLKAVAETVIELKRLTRHTMTYHVSACAPVTDGECLGGRKHVLTDVLRGTGEGLHVNKMGNRWTQ